MASGEHSFISSTNWSERVGPSAALATIELFEKNESWRQVSDYGKQVKEFWVKEAKMNELDIDVFGLPAMAKFKFNYEESNLLKTVFTENMLSFGILATTQVNISTVHNQSHFNAYFAAASESFKLVKNLLTEIVEVPPHLKHSAAICKSDFARLN
jgi:glutamate-1-semialdehyde aminotransferase